MDIPRAGLITSPLVSSCLIILITSVDGIAKPIPSTAPLLPLLPVGVEEILLELIPITCPSILISGPPEFPGLIAASV